MVEDLDCGKTEIRIRLFSQLVATYENAIDGFFDHVLPLLKDNQDPAMSYYLGHNGITNMIGPILCLVRTKKTEYMPRILRALYSFESYQVMRRLIRNSGGKTESPACLRQTALDELLGINFAERGTPLPDMFTREDAEPHCTEAVIDAAALKKYKDAVWFVPYATLLQPLFEALIHPEGGDGVEAMQAISAMTPDSITQALDLPDSIKLDDFTLYNIVEGLLYGDKPSRIDKDTNKPKLGDLGNAGVGANMIKQYVQSRYEANYNDRLKQQLGQEQRILRDELIDQLIRSESLEQFISLLEAGRERGPISVVINRDSCDGFAKLHDALMDLSLNVPKRAAKLYVIYSGTCPVSNDPVFNGGNLYRTNWEPLKALLLSGNNGDVWSRLQKELETRGHCYRGGSDQCNRHGHSNDLPSYYAFGCLSLESFREMVDNNAWEKYTIEHASCCGVSEYLAKIRVAALQ